MFENVIDKKGIIVKNNEEIIDFTTSIFKQIKSSDVLYNVYRVPESMVMRPDLVSLAEYDNDEYTDILLKYNNISNPFSLDKNDIILLPTINSVENDLAEVQVNKKNSEAEYIRNYHRYIDKSKAPVTIGSEVNTVNIDKVPSNNYEEANLLQNDNVWIKATPDKIYFSGSNKSSEHDYDKSGNGTVVTLRNGRILFGDDNVDCGINGMTSSSFMVSKIENDL